jgi:hypothetical protein
LIGFRIGCIGKQPEIKSAWREGWKASVTKPHGTPVPEVRVYDPGNPYEKQAALVAKYPQSLGTPSAPPVVLVTRGADGSPEFIARARSNSSTPGEIATSISAKEKRQGKNFK